jgi:hypothetical protein
LITLIEVLKPESLGKIVSLPIFTIILFCPFTVSFYIIQGLVFISIL